MPNGDDGKDLVRAPQRPKRAVGIPHWNREDVVFTLREFSVRGGAEEEKERRYWGEQDDDDDDDEKERCFGGTPTSDGRGERWRF